MNLTDRNILLRIAKPYPEAHNHIYTGRITDYDRTFLEVDGCVLNFTRPTTEDPTGGLTISPRAIRWIPVERVQYIRQLTPGTDPFDPEAMRITEEGNIVPTSLNRPDELPA